MPNDLNDFYHAIGTTITGNTLQLGASLDFDTISNSDIVCPIFERGFLSVEGVEAAKFLQGQVTCNLNELSASNTLLGAACTYKGRMFSSFRLIKLSDTEIVMCMDKDIVATTEETLAKYIVFSKAKFINRCEELIAFGISGPNSTNRVNELFGTAPSEINQSVHNAAAQVIKISNKPRYELLLPLQEAQTFWDRLAINCQVVGSYAWQLLNIEDGLGEIRQETIDLFIPQMLSFNKVGAISFSKGCYTGQEIVARMEYRGELKRRMVRAAIPSNQFIKPGEEIFSESAQQSVGNVVMSAHSTAEEQQVLAVITDKAIETNELSIMPKDNKTGHAIKLKLLTLTYAIT